MKPIVLILLILSSSRYTRAQAWVRLPDYTGTIRDDGIAVVLGTKAYVGTGLDPVSEMIDFKVFDFEKHEWAEIPAMPHTTERQYACGFGNDTALYVTCGRGPNSAIASTWRYSIAHQHWQVVTPKPGKGLMAAACFQFGNKIILAGGKGNNDSINYSVWEYDIVNNSWQQKSNLPFPPVWRAAYTTLNGEGYLLGGIDSVSRFSLRLYRYSPGSDQWDLYDSLPAPRGRAYHAMQGSNNRLFVFGGFDSLKTYYNDAFIYDPVTKKWHSAPALSAEGRKGGMSFNDGRNFYYTCGSTASGIRLNETWMTDVPLGIDDLNNIKNTVVLYPNPAHTAITITSSDQRYQTIQIFEMNGAKVYESVCSDKQQQIDVSNLAAGIYLVVLSSESETNKLLKFSILPK